MVLLSLLACAALLWWVASIAVGQRAVPDSIASGSMVPGGGGRAAYEPGGDTGGWDGNAAEGTDGSRTVGAADNSPVPKPAVDAYGNNGSTNTPASQCPVRLPADCLRIEHSTGSYTERWRAKSDMPCRDAAYELLLDLRSDGFSLNKAGFLDLSDESWGCTVTSAVGDVFVVSMIPESLGAVRNDNNRLTITVVRIVKPSFGNGQELG